MSAQPSAGTFAAVLPDDRHVINPSGNRVSEYTFPVSHAENCAIVVRTLAFCRGAG